MAEPETSARRRARQAVIATGLLYGAYGLLGLARTLAATLVLGLLVWIVYRASRKAVEWIREHADPDARIVEAVGAAYSDHGRIGAATGRPIVLGWTNHQGLWRGGAATDAIDSRKKDVETIYRSGDPSIVREALLRRGARYVVVGPLERKEYGPDPFQERGAARRVFSAGGTELWEVAR